MHHKTRAKKVRNAMISAEILFLGDIGDSMIVKQNNMA